MACVDAPRAAGRKGLPRDCLKSACRPSKPNRIGLIEPAHAGCHLPTLLAPTCLPADNAVVDALARNGDMPAAERLLDRATELAAKQGGWRQGWRPWLVEPDLHAVAFSLCCILFSISFVSSFPCRPAQPCQPTAAAPHCTPRLQGCPLPWRPLARWWLATHASSAWAPPLRPSSASTPRAARLTLR